MVRTRERASEEYEREAPKRTAGSHHRNEADDGAIEQDMDWEPQTKSRNPLVFEIKNTRWHLPSRPLAIQVQTPQKR